MSLQIHHWQNIWLFFCFSLNPSFFQLRLLSDLSALQATKDDHNFFSCCYRILFPFLIRRRTQHGEMKVKAAHYFFTSEQEQNQMFHICSCSLQALPWESQRSVSMQYSPLLQNRDGDLSQNTDLLVPDVPVMRTQCKGWLAFNKSHPGLFGHPGERRGNNHSRAIPLLCPLGQMFLHHHYRFHNKGMCSNAVSEWTGRSTEI